jgi:tRNA(Ile)-lysidine synthase TilS/MesJ
VEELKIGDWVEVIGPDDHGFGHAIGNIFRVDMVNLPSEPFPWAANKITATYPVKSLRKLPPEEITMHTGTIGYQAQACHDELKKAQDAIRKLLAPLVDERLSAIEECQKEHRTAIVSLRQSHLYLADEELARIKKRLDVHEDTFALMRQEFNGLEAYQKSEMPEVCESPLTDLGAIAAIASFAPVPECVAAFIRQETEVAEKRKLEAVCHPNTKPIRITISRGQDDTHCFTDTCPSDCLSWAEKVLDSMREA